MIKVGCSEIPNKNFHQVKILRETHWFPKLPRPWKAKSCCNRYWNMFVPNFTLLCGDTLRLFSVFAIQENYSDVTRAVLESVSKSTALSAGLAPALPVGLAQPHYQQLQPTSQTNGADPAHPLYAHNERFPKDGGTQKTCQHVHPNILICSCYTALWLRLSAVNIPWFYQHLISNLKAAADQPARLIQGNSLFYNVLLWLMRPFPAFHTHLFQVWDSHSVPFSFGPGSHHKSPAVVQLPTITGNQQNQILGCYLPYVIWSFVFPFCICVWSHYGTWDCSGSFHRSSQTEMIQETVSSSLTQAMLVWLQWAERHGPHC